MTVTTMYKTSAPTRNVVDLPVRACQWHGGQKDEEGFLVFCGKPVRPDTSYCPEHYRRVYARSSAASEIRAAAAEAAGVDADSDKAAA